MLKSLAEGRFAQCIAQEGGMESALWGGEVKGGSPRRIIITVEHSLFEYHVEVGVDCDPGNPSLFLMDPKIRVEKLHAVAGSSKRLVASRKGNQVQLADSEWDFDAYEFPVLTSESLLSQIAEPAKYPFISLVCHLVGGWKFYHEFDTGSSSALRQPQVSYWSPSLDDGALNLASVIVTTWEGGFKEDFEEIFQLAFPDMRLSISSLQNRLVIEVYREWVSRPLQLSELSDGTLRFLCLAAALLSLDKPDLIVLNEPEMSLNESVYPAIAQLVEAAAKDSQVVVVSHASELAAHLERERELRHIKLAIEKGQSRHQEHLGKKKVWEFD